MPDLCLELHDRWAEGVLGGYLDVHKVCGAFVRCVWRAIELASEMCEIFAISSRFNDYLGELVILNVENLLCDTTVSVIGHGVCEGEADGW